MSKKSYFAKIIVFLWYCSGSSLYSQIIIDHTCTDASQIPQSYLDLTRERDVLFCHKSIGTNIMDGIADLAAQDPTRYSINTTYDMNVGWFSSNDGLGHKTSGHNYHPGHKCSTFNNDIRDANFGMVVEIAFFKFCVVDFICKDWWGDMRADSIWSEYYKPTMEALERDYPDVCFVWWSAPLSDRWGNDEKEIFNTLTRDYCESNGKILFDIADIESHDTLGEFADDVDGYEAMWAGYATDGTHLNKMGRKKVASAFWWLFARISRWNPGGYRGSKLSSKGAARSPKLS